MYKIGIKPLIYRIILRIKDDKKIVSSEAYGFFFFFWREDWAEIKDKLWSNKQFDSDPGFLFFIMAFSEVHKKEQYSEYPYTHQLASTVSSKMLLLFQLSLIHSYCHCFCWSIYSKS